MAINQEKNSREGQFEYRGRWVDIKHFRTHVYNEIENRLANSYVEYKKLVASGLWFDSKDEAILSNSEKIDKEFEESVQKAEENLSNVTNINKKQKKPKLR